MAETKLYETTLQFAISALDYPLLFSITESIANYPFIGAKFGIKCSRNSIATFNREIVLGRLQLSNIQLC